MHPAVLYRRHGAADDVGPDRRTALLTAFGRAFRTPDLRKKMLFTLAILALFRLGFALPAPGRRTQAVHTCLT